MNYIKIFKELIKDEEFKEEFKKEWKKFLRNIFILLSSGYFIFSAIIIILLFGEIGKIQKESIIDVSTVRTGIILFIVPYIIGFFTGLFLKSKEGDKK